MENSKILGLLEKAKTDCREFEEKYQGPGFSKKIKRVLRYKMDYIKYSLGRFGIYRKFNFLSYFGILNGGIREIKSIHCILKNIEPGDVFYDIGANQGLFSVIVNESFGKQVEIHAFEPIPYTFKILQKNLPKKENIFLNNIALLDREGEIKFKVPKNESLLASSTIANEYADKYLKNYYEIKVSCTSLYEYIKNHKPPTIVKMDVEGAEPFIIDGGKKIFSEFSPQIIMEIQTGNVGLEYSLKAAKKLEELGYKIYKIDDETNGLKPISLKELENFIKERQDLNEDNFVFKK